jgi:anti-sigma regulatory factor (Ser/Thr protein kinase)
VPLERKLRAAVFERRELAIAADLSRLREAREFAAEAAREFGFDDDSCYAIKLAMSEGVANAIQHGSEPGDAVTLSVLAVGDVLVFQVADRGRFVPRIAPRGDLPERGRGLEFMTRLMDEVDLVPRAEGTVLRFSKRRD